MNLKRIFLIIPAIIIIPLAISWLDRPLVLFPSRNLFIGGMSSPGKSEIITLVQTDSAIIFEYIINSGSEDWPFAGIYLMPKKENKLMNLSHLQFLRLDIRSSRSQTVRLFFKTFVPGFTSPDISGSFRHVEYVLYIDKDKRSYIIPLKDFAVPDWWYGWQQTSEKAIGAEKLKNVDNFAIHSGIVESDIPDRIIIDHISFYNSYKQFYTVSAIAVVFYYLLYVLIFFLLKQKDSFHQIRKKESEPLELPHKPLELEDENEKLHNSIMNIIKEHYADSNFSIHDISSELGLSEKKTVQLIKDKFGVTFKQLLNRIRMMEAKRLLLSTNMTITDIAFTIGYNNITHFNRIFKEDTGLSAGSFRKESKKTIP